MILKNFIKSDLKKALLLYLPLAFGASLVDGIVLYGIKSFMKIIEGKGILWQWLLFMLLLTTLRFILLQKKEKIGIVFLFNESAKIKSWFLNKLRKLHPKNFHDDFGEKKIEAAYEASLILQNHGSIIFQGIQAILQLIVFLPVLFYISWGLSIFLFIVIVPMVSLIQQKLHKLGPTEEFLVESQGHFRRDLELARHLYKKWSSQDERKNITLELLKKNKDLKNLATTSSIKKNLLTLWAESVSIFAMILILGFCAFLMSKNLMSPTDIILFTSAVLLCYKPIKECSKLMPQFRSVKTSLKILEDFESLKTLKNTSYIFCSNSLKITNGHFGYKNGTEVFNHFNLDLNFKKPVLIRGKNGSGKTTFLRLISGLEFWDDKINLPLQNVFYVAQDLELPPLKMLLDLLDNLKNTNDNFRKTLLEFIENTGAKKLLKKTAWSGGERSRLSLVWALTSTSKIILLDEPFASIALKEREFLLKNYLDAAQKLNKWTIIVSHDNFTKEIENEFNVVYF